MIWFWVPASLVICNDIFAYVWGTSLSISGHSSGLEREAGENRGHN